MIDDDAVNRSPSSSPRAERSRRIILQSRTGWIIWLVAIVAVCTYGVVTAGARDGADPYSIAVQHWFNGADIYADANSPALRDPPLSVLLFAPFSLLPEFLGQMLWRIISIGAFAVGLYRLCRVIKPELFALATLITLPLMIEAAGNGQTTVLMTAGMMIAAAALSRRRWTNAAGWLTIAVALKPLAVVLAMLAAALRPRKMLHRLAALALVAGLLPFLFQSPSYVAAQYQAWFAGYAAGDSSAAGVFSMLAAFGVETPHPAQTAMRVLFAIITLGASIVAVRRLAPGAFACVLYTLAAVYVMLFSPATGASMNCILAPGLGLLAAYAFVVRRAYLTGAILTLGGVLAAAPLPAVWLAPLVTCLIAAWLGRVFLRPDRFFDGRDLAGLLPPAPDDAPPSLQWANVNAYVGDRATTSLLATPISIDECRELIDYCRRRQLTLCLRGSGHSYGDMALNDGQVLLNVRSMNRILDFDESTGRIRVEPGVQVIDIYKRAHAKGFALPASPTESTITIGGAIAADVNGKDSFRVGNFSDQVVSLKLLTSEGELIDVNRGHELFGAVIGGMGLIGLVVEATLQLKRVPSPDLSIDRTPVRNLKELFAALDDVRKTSDFAVVWLDTCAKRGLGRGVIHATRWVEARNDDPPARIEAGFRRLARRRRVALRMYGVTSSVFNLLLEAQRVSVRFFNWLYFVYSVARRSLGRSDNTELFLRYNFDASFAVPPASLVCGEHGYTIQALLPQAEAHDGMREIIRICQQSPCPPVTSVLRLHRADDCLVAFADDGVSINLEIHPKPRHEERMNACVEELVACVARRGGRIHLAKDMVLTSDQFRQLFPGYREFLRLKQQVDPGCLFTSDLYRRLLEPLEAELDDLEVKCRAHRAMSPR